MSVAADLKAFGQQCTDFLWATVAWTKGLTGNAGTWAQKAPYLGLSVGSSTSAVIGSIAVWEPGQGGAESAGHVAQVVGFVNDAQGTPWPIVQEQNWGYNNLGLGNPDTRLLTPDQTRAAKYIQPPAGVTVPAPIDPASFTSNAPHYGQLDLGSPVAQNPADAPAGFADTFGKLATGSFSGASNIATSAAGLMVSALGNALASAVAYIGTAIAHTFSVAAEDVGAFASNHVLPLAVAGVVLAALFA